LTNFVRKIVIKSRKNSYKEFQKSFFICSYDAKKVRKMQLKEKKLYISEYMNVSDRQVVAKRR
jgi:hypothetical protein